MNGQPHRASNQAEFAWRPSRFARTIQTWRTKAFKLLIGDVHYKPYFASLTKPKGDLGDFRFDVHVERPVVPKKHAHGYRGESFMRMQPFYTRPHPSGLPDNAYLRTPKPKE